VTRPANALLFAAVLAAPALGPSAHAQAADSAHAGASPVTAPPAAAGPAADGCTYDRCALRIEEGIVMQGIEGRRVTTPTLLGGLSGGVEWRSDLARRYARRADARHRTARVLQSVGTLASLAGAGLVLREMQNNQSVTGADDGAPGTARVNTGRLYTAAGLVVGSTALGWAGRAVARGARQQLARAVWWHNRELTQPRQ
jgi:hypothetical protein